METKTSIQNPSIFLTDYASYNNGTQFEFGHWVDLTDFTDADELNEYIKNHFEEADEKSPLGWGAIREEIMITDFENFPRSLYSESGMNFENVYEFIDLDDNDKIKVAFIMEQCNDFDYAISHYENVDLTENTRDNIYDLFEMYYPEALESESKCNYITIDYDRFVKENYTEFDFDGTNYLINDNWNN
jgi:hypothetical protein